MSVEFACPCGRTIRADREMAGKQVECPNCGRSVKVPDLSRPSPEEPVATVATRCTCGRTIQVKKELAGRVVRCPECGAPVPIPADAPSGSSGDAKWAQPWEDLAPMAGAAADPLAAHDTSTARASGLRTRRPLPVFAKRVFVVDVVLCALSLACVSPALIWAAAAGSVRIEGAPPPVELQGQLAFQEAESAAAEAQPVRISPFSVMVNVLIAVVSLFADSFMLARKPWAYYLAVAAVLLTIIGLVAPLPQLAEGIMGMFKADSVSALVVGKVFGMALAHAVRIGYFMLYASAVVRFSKWAASAA